MGISISFVCHQPPDNGGKKCAVMRGTTLLMVTVGCSPAAQWTLGGAALVPGCQVAPCWGYMDIMGPPAAKFTDYYVLLTLVLG